MTRPETDEAIDILMFYLRDGSSIVKTFAMQALADLGMRDSALLTEVTPIIERLTQAGTPAMKARGRKLLRDTSRRQLARVV